MDPDAVAREVRTFLLSLLYALIGLGLLALAFRIFDAITPLDLGKVIFEERNTAAAIAVGFFLLALSIIIAAAIHG